MKKERRKNTKKQDYIEYPKQNGSVAGDPNIYQKGVRICNIPINKHEIQPTKWSDDITDYTKISKVH